MEKSCEECLRYFNSGGEGGFNCAESTVFGLTRILDIQANDLVRIATPFGGGVGRNGYVCGSLLMGILLLGYKYGRDDPNDPRAPAYQAADTLLRKFLSQYGSINCRELTGLDLKRIDNTGEEKLRVHETVCKPIVLHVCQWVREMIEKGSQGPNA